MSDDQDGCEWVFLLVPAYLGCPDQRPLNGCVCVYRLTHVVLEKRPLNRCRCSVSFSQKMLLLKLACHSSVTISVNGLKCYQYESHVTVVWPIMSCFADWSKCHHVTLSIIICSPLHSHPGWQYNMTWCSLNANVRFILHCFCLRLVCFFGI